MRKNLLRLPPERILVEQLRLILVSITTSLLPVTVSVLVILWILRDEGNRFQMGLWGLGQVAASLNAARFARSRAGMPMSEQQAHQAVHRLMLVLALEGTLWGALSWIALDGATLGGSLLVMAIIIGLAGTAAPIQGTLPVAYYAFLLPICVLVGAKLWVLGDLHHRSMFWGMVLCAAMMIGQARRIGRTVLRSIELRFENAELMEKLRLESGHADAARREAEQANLAKSKFLAAASHDLRQPIHAQGLFLDVLARTELSPMQQELLASVGAASTASAEMLNTLLDFSRIEAGVVQPEIQAFKVQVLLNKIEREFVQQADAKGLEYRSRESTLTLQSDPALVEMILRNLVSNAIRYTERGGVLVTCRRRGDKAVLEVYDTGIGIETSQQAAVFREFHQLGNPERDRAKGLGLGLAIVEGLARTLGHRLSLRSKSERGSVFRLTLPVTTAAQSVDPSADEPRAAQLLHVRVLVVDDDESVRHSMLHLLRDWGCECEAVESLEAAVMLARAWTPELVICDYRLRNHCTGVEVIEALRAELGQDLLAVLITGDTAPQRLREAIGSGLPLLHKPVSPSRLYRELVTVLRGDLSRRSGSGS
jgi:signal transduction histidine kinase